MEVLKRAGTIRLQQIVLDREHWKCLGRDSNPKPPRVYQLNCYVIPRQFIPIEPLYQIGEYVSTQTLVTMRQFEFSAHE